MVDESTVRRRPALFRALGNSGVPAVVSVGGKTYRIDTTLKHDSWAATAIYVDDNGVRIICKFNRTQPIFGVPMRWLGRRLGQREAWFLRRLADVELIPSDLGPVSVDGSIQANAVARVFIEGRAFQHADQVDAAFFEELLALMATVHARDLAYVDSHKRENVIVDPQRRPHLVDFQVSYALSPSWPGNGPTARWVLRRLQEIDDYNLRKHVLRCCPDMVPPADREAFARVPAVLRAHRTVAVPLRSLRRKLLVRLGIRARGGSAHTELEPEAAFRDEKPR